ncbi:hypothetical protein GG344DRAFT_81180 [Lentinula edodes]|nr:hypothetical protein GG344DRAFT_81180 [Lentinula edodes]
MSLGRARSNLHRIVTLENKDQLDNENKEGLEVDLEGLQKQNKDLVERNRMQLEQVNVLLPEKVNLRSEGIGQSEKMLQRERDFGYVNALAELQVGADTSLHEDDMMSKELLKTSDEKLTKAKIVRAQTSI